MIVSNCAKTDKRKKRKKKKNLFEFPFGIEVTRDS